MPDLIVQFGYVGVFVTALLGSTVLPFSTAALVVALPAAGFHPVPLTAFATVGHVLGALTSYALGRYGQAFILSRYWTPDPQKVARAHSWFEKWGQWVLLLTWVPVVGDGVCVVAGSLQMGYGRFVAWVAAGRVLQYGVLMAPWLLRSE